MSALFTQALDPLVEEGTITSAQETAVVAALTSSRPDGGPGQGGEGQPEEMPSLGAPPPGGQVPSSDATPPGGQLGAAPQGSAPDPSRMFSSALDALVSDGTITRAQETAITEALNSAMLQGGPGRQGGATQTQSGGSTATSSAQTY
jgi:hypothetical protein